MYRVVEREVLDFIIPGGTKNWIPLNEFRQDFLNFFVVYKTEMPCVNGVKDL